MSLTLLQELSGQYSKALNEGLHKLLLAATENRDYKDAGIISTALSTLKDQDAVTEIGYRNGAGDQVNKEPPKGMEERILEIVVHFFKYTSEISSQVLIDSVRESLRMEMKFDYLDYTGKTKRPYWKVCVEQATENLLKSGAITKSSRYKYVSNICEVDD